jgi:hypothetical protein
MMANNNMYNSKFLDEVKNDEFSRGAKLYEKAKQPMITGVVPTPAYASLFTPDITSGNTVDKDGNVNLLSGEKMNFADFKHNNMQPFLRKGITQNTDIEKFTQRLDMNTGNDRYYTPKREVPNMFKPVKGYSNVNGSRQFTDFFKSRIEAPRIQNNVGPSQKVYVGPGLNQGYSSVGTGGFHQADTNKYATPKTLNELRSKVNQKQTYFEVPFQSPVKGVEQRGIVSPYSKNRPETTYAMTEDNLLPTTGAVIKETGRPELALKNPSRSDMHVEYSGGAKYENIKGIGSDDDYGKSKIMIYNNEREKTESCTVVSNLTTNVKALIMPVIDAMKLSLKEYLVDAPRSVGGNAKAQMPSKGTVYDPSDVTKTTVKETTLQDSDTLNLTGPNETYSAMQDQAKTTIKETLVHDSDHLNIKPENGCSYVMIEDDAKTTIRETLPMIDTKRNIGSGVYKVYVYNPEIALKKTVRETVVIGSSEFGFIGGVINSILGGYICSEVELKNTHKQFTSDNGDFGIAKYINRFMQTNRNIEIETDGSREKLLIDASYTAPAGNMNIPLDKTDVDMKTNKLITDSYAVREAGNVNVIYQRTPVMHESVITKDKDITNAFANRLDKELLEPLKYNDLNINIVPI